MPSMKHKIPLLDDGHVDLETWLDLFCEKFGADCPKLIREAATLALHTGTDKATNYGVSCLRQGLEMADILISMGLDAETLAAAIIYSTVQFAGLGVEDVKEQLGDDVANIVSGARQMDAIHISHGRLQESAQLSSSIDNLRKMMLAMVEDVRVVLLKLAERLTVLRHVAPLSDSERKKVAKETIDIFSPLANRLGVAQLKWALEDYAFRYLEPEQYKKISKTLNQRRDEREFYVEKMVSEIQDKVEKLKVKKFEVYGRAKHIYSIFRKMDRKHLPVDEIYDVIAIRVLVPSIEDCYAVLGEVQETWKPIKKEFDDYIANPKPNGYQSIHSAVIGPDDHVFEVQIRTFEMHQIAELGVAAHWIYKEGKKAKSTYEAKIAWLRNVMDWQQEIVESDEQEAEAFTHIFQDRIYVFTPRGDVIDLPTGSTSLDFAYSIHSEVGNRCRGAKVNGKLQPLTYQLKMGDQVDVMIDKKGHPSRDWLNPHQGYLFTSKAKAKVLHYFRHQDFQRHVSEGEEALAREAKRLHIQPKLTPELMAKLNLKNKEEVLASIGRGDFGAVTVLNAITSLQEKTAPVKSVKSIKKKPKKPVKVAGSDVTISGVGNLLTNIARCCKPVPGDEITGYVTLGRGVSIHRADCANVIRSAKINEDRIIDVSWGKSTSENYVVDIRVTANDRPGLMKDISNLLSTTDVTLIGLNCAVDKTDRIAHVSISVEVDSIHPLRQVIHNLRQIPDVVQVRRRS